MQTILEDVRAYTEQGEVFYPMVLRARRYSGFQQALAACFMRGFLTTATCGVPTNRTSPHDDWPVMLTAEGADVLAQVKL